jgi:hypothetical protein
VGVVATENIRKPTSHDLTVIAAIGQAGRSDAQVHPFDQQYRILTTDICFVRYHVAVARYFAWLDVARA